MSASVVVTLSTSKYQVPAKLFKKLGKESSGMLDVPSSPTLSSRSLLSPRTKVSKSKLKPQILSSIPVILRDCVDYLREEDRDRTQGLFRVPGDSSKVDSLLEMYERERDISQEAFENTILQREKPSAHDVSTVMKRYLMKMADPLLSDADKKDFIAIVQKGLSEEKDKQLIAYEVVVRGLEIPEEHRSCLSYILRFLLLVSGDTEDTTKMSVESLAKMFAPIILRDDAVGSGQGPPATLHDQRKMLELAIVVTEILIWNAVELIPRG